MTAPCETVRTPGASVSVEDWDAIRAAAEAAGVEKYALGFAALHLLATWPTKETPDGL